MWYVVRYLRWTLVNLGLLLFHSLVFLAPVLSYSPSLVWEDCLTLKPLEILGELLPPIAGLRFLWGIWTTRSLAGSAADIESYLGMSWGTQWGPSQYRVGVLLCIWWSSCAVRNFWWVSTTFDALIFRGNSVWFRDVVLNALPPLWLKSCHPSEQLCCGCWSPLLSCVSLAWLQW